MKEIEVACAGAGKTYGLALKIINEIKNRIDNKLIYAITYTNAAVNKIREEITKNLGIIPEFVIIETIHKFILNSIIYPYSFFTISQPISSCSIQKLPNEFKYKNSSKKRLKDESVIHSEDVFSFGKKILCYTTNDTKSIKKRKDIALNNLTLPIHYIFIDEVQDMDDDFFDMIERIGSVNINISMVGDIRQALKHPFSFKNFLSNTKHYSILPYINITRRVPKSFLNITNELFGEEYKCTTLNVLNGTINYCFLDNFNWFNNLPSYDLIYIKQKNDNIDTEKERIKVYFDKEIKKLIIKDKDVDEDAYLYYFESKIKEFLRKSFSLSIAVNKTLRHFGVQYDSKIFAKIISQYNIVETKKFNVYSIEKAKGLEGENCLFITCPSLLNLLFKMKENKQNKETNLLYVALTRSKNKMTLLIDKDSIDKFTKEIIHSNMISLGIMETK